MLSLPNLAFATIVVVAAVTPLVNPTPKSVSEPERLVSALKSAGADVRPVEGPGDVSRYDLELVGCKAAGRLVVAGYGQRALLREEAARMSASRQIYVSGEPAMNLDEGALTRAYLADQFASKTGLREEGPWSRRITLFDPPRHCGSDFKLQWDVSHRPALVTR